VTAVTSTGMDWKLSVATESCECSKMKAPVVVLRFRVADASGQVRLEGRILL